MDSLAPSSAPAPTDRAITISTNEQLTSFISSVRAATSHYIIPSSTISPSGTSTVSSPTSTATGDSEALSKTNVGVAIGFSAWCVLFLLVVFGYAYFRRPSTVTKIIKQAFKFTFLLIPLYAITWIICFPATIVWLILGRPLYALVTFGIRKATKGKYGKFNPRIYNFPETKKKTGAGDYRMQPGEELPMESTPVLPDPPGYDDPDADVKKGSNSESNGDNSGNNNNDRNNNIDASTSTRDVLPAIPPSCQAQTEDMNEDKNGQLAHI